jgi:hypothetical protein
MDDGPVIYWRLMRVLDPSLGEVVFVPGVADASLLIIRIIAASHVTPDWPGACQSPMPAVRVKTDQSEMTLL